MNRLLGLLLCCSMPALANEVALATSRDMYLEFKVSPFTPLIDSAFTDKSPYQTVFGGGPLLLGEIEYEYQFFQKFGALAAGLSVGYGEKFAKGFLATDGVTRSDDSTGLRLVPIKALLTYRFDYFWVHGNVPLVPFVKGAVVVMPWFITKGADIEIADGVRGAGVKVGLAATVGLSFALDFLDRRLARDFDNSTGINHTYLFGEFTTQAMTLFEPPSNTTPLNLSSNHFDFGIGFEF
jgi:hypothetical protein